MAPVLVVGDSPGDASSLRTQVDAAGYEGLTVSDGAGLAASLERCHWSLILMGRASPVHGAGLDAASLQQRFPGIPVVVLTGDQVDESAKQALQSGIAGCLPRTRIESDLRSTLDAILAAGGDAIPDDPASPPCWSMCYTIDNDPELLPLVAGEARRRLLAWPFRDPIELVRVTLALSESLDNALYHGNLELSSDLRQGDGRAWRDESLRRRAAAPYCQRRLQFRASIGRRDASFTVRDEGPGFNPHDLDDCRETRNLHRCSGRGLLLMRMYMDEIRFNPTGNEVTLVKRRPMESA